MPWDIATRDHYTRSTDQYELNGSYAEWCRFYLWQANGGSLLRQIFAPSSMPSNTILATGFQWRALPQCFPPFTTVQHHFYKWRNSHVLDDLMEALRPMARRKAGRGPKPTVAVIDSPSVKTTESGGPCGYYAGKKIKGRKRPITVEMEVF